MSLDGTRAYTGRYDGFTEIDLATGNVLRAVWLPVTPDVSQGAAGQAGAREDGGTLYLVTLP